MSHFSIVWIFINWVISFSSFFFGSLCISVCILDSSSLSLMIVHLWCLSLFSFFYMCACVCARVCV